MRRTIVVVLKVMAGVLGVAGPSSASQGEDRSWSRLAERPLEPQTVHAMEEAVRGHVAPLEQFLAGTQAEEMRRTIAAWIASHPTADPESSRVDLGDNSLERLEATGVYDHYCTGYNGVTIGWNNNVFRACHGTLRGYISGAYAHKYYPDVFPSGSGVTAACRDSYIDLGWTALGLLTGGAAGLGKLGTAVVGGASGWSVLGLWINCKRI